MNTNFPRALPHDPIEEVFPDLFRVQGRFDMQPGVRITRNMIIVREGRELTLLNSVRLSPEGEEALATLGEVKHLVKLGAFHGMDDPYYVHRYRPTLWAFPRARHPEGLVTDATLEEGGALPFGGASLFVFRNARFPEGAILWERQGGVLLTCDAVQNLVDMRGSSLLARVVATLGGFKRAAGIGPPWRRAMQQPGGPPLVADFQRLLTLPFQHALTGHGPPLKDTAHRDLAATVEKVWGR